LRTKRRYIALEVIGASKVSESEVITQTIRAHARYAGEKAFHKASPWVIEFDEESQTGIVRCNLGGLDDLRSSLALITQIHGEPVIFRSIGISGTIKACKDKFIRKSKPTVKERVAKRNEEEGPGRLEKARSITELGPGSRIKVSHEEFTLKGVFEDGRVDLASDEGSFGFTILDLLGSNLGNEGEN